LGFPVLRLKYKNVSGAYFEQFKTKYAEFKSFDQNFLSTFHSKYLINQFKKIQKHTVDYRN